MMLAMIIINAYNIIFYTGFWIVVKLTEWPPTWHHHGMNGEAAKTS